MRLESSRCCTVRIARHDVLLTHDSLSKFDGRNNEGNDARCPEIKNEQ